MWLWFAAAACMSRRRRKPTGWRRRRAPGRSKSERQQKAQHLEPDQPSGIEHALNVIKEKKIIERITSGIAGFRVHMGGLITGSGFAAGPEYYRRDLLNDQVIVARLGAGVDTRSFI